MDRAEFLNKMLINGRITQEEHDIAVVNLQVKIDAIAKYKKEKSKLTKAELQELLDKLT